MQDEINCRYDWIKIFKWMLIPTAEAALVTS